MRKIISVLLVALMLFSVVAVSASAADACGCKDHREDIECRCCIYCPTLPKEYIKSCAKDGNGNPTGEFCCQYCAGYYKKGTDCGCTCSCCGESGSTGGNGIIDPDLVWGEQQQKNFVTVFQSILGKISAAFDNFWNAIKEFLKIDQVLPN